MRRDSNLFSRSVIHGSSSFLLEHDALYSVMYTFCRVLSRPRFRGMIKFYLLQVAEAFQK